MPFAADSGDDSVHADRPPSRARRRPLGHGKRDPSGKAFQASWLSSVINLLNTIVGAGVLAMPLAMSHMGIVLGTLVILWSGVTAGFGLYLQTRCAAYLQRGSASFFALSQITYPNAAVIFDAAIAIKCFGVGVSYLIIIGDLMPGVVRGFTDEESIVPFLVDRHFWVTAFMLVVMPLSFLRRLDSLKYTSVIALISIGYLVILVVYHFAAHDTLPSGYETPIRIIHWAGAVQTLSSFPVIVFAYTCHQNMFSILNEIADNSQFNTSSVVFASNGTAAAIYILVAITGYLSFGNEIGGNVVAQYAPSVSATIGRAAIVVLVMFSYPLQAHPCRASVDAVLKWRPNMKQTSKSSPSSRPSSSQASSPTRSIVLAPGKRRMTVELSELRFAIITTAILILSYIVAMTVSSLEAVLAYVGSTGSTAISFILPGLFYYKISSPDSLLHQRLVKEEDDFDADEEEEAVDFSGGSVDGEQQGLLRRMSNSGLEMLKKTKGVRRTLLRRLSLALAIYGCVVMVVCLITNTFLNVVH